MHHATNGLAFFNKHFSHVATSRKFPARKRIALVAHDNKKKDLIDWASYNRAVLARHELFATGTTGRLLSDALDRPVHGLHSGPLGGDLQIGAFIAEGKIDVLIFFWDPMEAQPHDPDIKALLRIGVVWNIPIACDRATADFLLTSPLMQDEYEAFLPDYSEYTSRKL
jgi:methylglyoxal synthase